MTSKNEPKHARFLRLAQNRLTRAMDQLRLLSQLAKPDYEYYPEETEEIVRHLDGSVRRIAEVFGVEYATRIGKAASQTTNGARSMGVTLRKPSVLDEIECFKALEHLRAGRTEEVERVLHSGLHGTAGAA